MSTNQSCEQLAAWMIKHSFATGHGDTFEDLLKELSWQVKELRRKHAEARLVQAEARLEALEEAAQQLELWAGSFDLSHKGLDTGDTLRGAASTVRALAQAGAPAKEKVK